MIRIKSVLRENQPDRTKPHQYPGLFGDISALRPAKLFLFICRVNRRTHAIIPPISENHP